MAIGNIIHLGFVIGGAAFGGFIGTTGVHALLTRNSNKEIHVEVNDFDEDDDSDFFLDDEEEDEDDEESDQDEEPKEEEAPAPKGKKTVKK